MPHHTRLAAVWALIVAAWACHAQSSEPWDMLTAKPEVVAAWKDMRFGMFVCWGPVTLTGQEIGWSRGAPRGHGWLLRPGQGATPGEIYDNLYKKWNPDRFDAREWVNIAQASGMKYMIFLVKHHDGFSLYDTRLSEYRSTAPAAAWKHDAMRDVADACHAAGLKLIIYYSQPDWYHPDYGTANHRRYVAFLHGQIRELLTNYGRIDGLWFDLGGKPTDWDSAALFKMARTLQPDLIINNRCGLRGDYDTPEQHVGRCQLDRPWESCITLGTQWSWKPDDALKPYTDAVQMLVACAVGDGNLALNTNPMPDGRIEPRQVERFQQVGQWLKKYGESIYGTRGGPLLAPSMGRRHFGQDRTRFALPGGEWWGGSTHKDRTLYLHILRWPSDALRLAIGPRKVVRHAVLTGGAAVLEQTAQTLVVSVPKAHRDPLDTIIKLELDGPARDIPVVIPLTKSGSLATGKNATASTFYQNNPTYAPAKAVDDDPDTRWGCDHGTRSCWLEVDLGQSRTFHRALLSEPYDRVRKFALEVFENGGWRTFYSGTTIGEQCAPQFPPVTGQRVRLNILEATDGPSIWEFQLFAPLEKKAADYAPAGKPIDGAVEPLRQQFSARKAAEYLDAQVHTSEKQCFGCHDTYSYLPARALLAWPAPALAQTRRAVEQAIDGPPGRNGTPEKSVLQSAAYTVMTAATLVRDDLATSGKLRAQTRTALDRMWELQQSDGGWNWIKAQEPPSAVDDHFGATMAVVAAGAAPEGYARTPLARAGLEKVGRYLKKHLPQTMHQRLMLLQAAQYLPDLLTAGQRQQTVSDLFASQRPDGGWTMAALVDWKRIDRTPQEFERSDGYGTGIVVYTLRTAAGVPAADPRLGQAVAWLKTHQRESGAWFTRSPRKADALTTFAGTAYAILALAACGELRE